MVATKIFFGCCMLFGIAFQVDCEDLALSTSVYNNLAEVFTNIGEVKWRLLSRLLSTIYDSGSDGLSVSANVVGKLSKGVGSTINYASRGLGYAKDLTTRSLDYVTNGIQTGVGYVSNGLNSLGSTAENYGRKWSVGSNKSSSRK